jgi:hypothetical protein
MHAMGPTLEIINSGSLVYRVTVNAGVVVQVHPGQHKCVWAGLFHEARRMEVFEIASGITYFTPREDLMTSPGWVLEIGQAPKYDVLSLRPSDPCKV